MRVAVVVMSVYAAWGQGGVEGVRSGFLYDAPTASVRVVEGVPGAAHLGAAVVGGVEAGWVSPTGRAMVARREGVWLGVSGLGTEGEESRELGVDVDRVRWSETGRFAVVQAGTWMGIWDAERMEWARRMDAGEREVTDVTICDGGAVWAGWVDGEGTVVARWSEGAWVEAGRVAGPARMACVDGKVAVGGAGEVVVLGEDGELWRAATGREDAPAGVAVQGGDVVLAFGGEGPELVWWKLAGGDGARAALEVAPAGLEPVGGGDALLLRSRAREGEEIWVAVRRGGEWVAFFVPAGELR